MSQLRRFGFSVFAIDYRGFGKSDGELPSEASVYEDARAGWQWLTAREPDASRRYIYGHSLGGAVAIDLAANLPGDAAGAKGLIVESSFTSLSEVVSEMGYGWVPARMLLTQKFDSIEKIRQIRMPVLIVHGADDRYVPPRLERGALRGGPAAEEAAADSERNAQQQRVDGRRRLSSGLAGALRAGRPGIGRSRGVRRCLAPCGRDGAGQPGAGPQAFWNRWAWKNRPNSPRIGGSNRLCGSPRGKS